MASQVLHLDRNSAILLPSHNSPGFKITELMFGVVTTDIVDLSILMAWAFWGIKGRFLQQNFPLLSSKNKILDYL